MPKFGKSSRGTHSSSGGPSPRGGTAACSRPAAPPARCATRENQPEKLAADGRAVTPCGCPRGQSRRISAHASRPTATAPRGQPRRIPAYAGHPEHRGHGAGKRGRRLVRRPCPARRRAEARAGCHLAAQRHEGLPDAARPPRPQRAHARRACGRVPVLGRPLRLRKVDLHPHAQPRDRAHERRARSSRARICAPSRTGASRTCAATSAACSRTSSCFPSKTAFENVAFALEVIGKSRHVINTAGAPRCLRLVGLEEKMDQLSRPALRRRAAARLHRALHRQPPAAAHLRRAHGQSRPADLAAASCACSSASTARALRSSWPRTTARWSTRCVVACSPWKTACSSATRRRECTAYDV